MRNGKFPCCGLIVASWSFVHSFTVSTVGGLLYIERRKLRLRLEDGLNVPLICHLFDGLGFEGKKIENGRHFE